MVTKQPVKFTAEDLDNCWLHYKIYLLEVLNGEYGIATARKDLQSLIGSKYDLRVQEGETNERTESE